MKCKKFVQEAGQGWATLAFPIKPHSVLLSGWGISEPFLIDEVTLSLTHLQCDHFQYTVRNGESLGDLYASWLQKLITILPK